MTNPPTRAGAGELLAVTQADREAVADYMVKSGIGTNSTWRGYRDGRFDYANIIQAFARHRIASTPSGAGGSDPTEAMIAAAWTEVDKQKRAGGLKSLGPGLGVVEIWRAMEAARLATPQANPASSSEAMRRALEEAVKAAYWEGHKDGMRSTTPSLSWHDSLARAALAGQGEG